ncbi:hypothetical protein HYH02_001582 [Chlamydomonas schloesseri]|uniref:TLC domain-containing protein n=1 Tax=Chlamydomonas schloesseri TaxID=2026947 RepID=A0A835WSG4_9CHLO|nr:hypothetical protein HYH02_001582 [Chlamydomonas schloesseri]|eukprot:KAG2453358.1 hypothetical protein HYH02_001582 [Chlamydomonas schloesseri]
MARPYLARIPEGLLRDYAAIGAIALAFWAVELVLLTILVPPLTQVLLQPPNKGADAKKQLKRARGAAVQTVARIVGTVHNTLQVPLGLLLLLDPRFSSNRVFQTSPLSYAVCYISAGYFLHDLVMCASRFALEGPLYTIHALVCHAAYAFGVTTGFIHYHGAAFLQWELSTTFVHLRWFMYKAGLANTTVYVLNGIAMVAVFFACRIAWGYIESVVLVGDVLRERWVPGGSPFPVGGTVGYCIAAVVMNSLNTYWFYKMFTAALAVLLGGKKASDVSSHKDD